MGLQAPSALEREAQQEAINLSRVQQDSSRLQQNILQQKLAEDQRVEEFKQKAADNYWSTLQDVNATPEQITSSKQGLFYAFPELAKQNEAMQKNATELQKGFASSMAKRLVVAMDSKDPNVIDTTFNELETAAKSKPELAMNLQGLKTIRDLHAKSTESAYGMARSVVADSDPKFLSEYYDSRKKQKEAEGVVDSELPLKEKNQFIEDQRKTWEKAFAPYNIRQENFSIIQNANPDKIGDTARIKAFVKMITPNESVMEGDVRSISNPADTVGGFLANIQRKFDSTGLLEQTDRDAIERESESLFNRSRGKVEYTRKSMTPLLKRNNVDPADVFIFDMGENAKKKEQPTKPNLTPYGTTSATLPSRSSAMAISAPPAKGGNLTQYQIAAAKRQADREAGLPVDNTPVDLGEPKFLELISPSGVQFKRAK